MAISIRPDCGINMAVPLQGCMPPRRSSANHALSPLSTAKLDELALAYVARFATTRAKLKRYLARKIQERGWDGEGDAQTTVDMLIARLTALGFVDDRQFAAMRGSAMGRRGLGAARVRSQLWVDGIAADDAAEAIAEAETNPFAAAAAFARRRRFGPFARTPVHDPRQRERQLAAFVRAGHAAALARRILALEPGDETGLAALDESAVTD